MGAGEGSHSGPRRTRVCVPWGEDCGLLINSSRGIIYASNGHDFAEKAGEEALKIQKEMANLLLEKGF